jgi:hypothetical protein
MGIDAEEMANQLAQDGASHTLTIAKPAKVARGEDQGLEHWQSIHEPKAS